MSSMYRCFLTHLLYRFKPDTISDWDILKLSRTKSGKDLNQ